MDSSLGRERPEVVLLDRALLSHDQYRSLAAHLAMIQAAKLIPIPDEPDLWWSSTADFWASICVTAGGETLFSDAWCGYPRLPPWLDRLRRAGVVRVGTLKPVPEIVQGFPAGTRKLEGNPGVDALLE
jgi:hypothetical protein